jgi:aminoglycoside phosphotransferase (APT) family kinase protein
LVHGELYASNVLVDEPALRVRAIDWETVGLGPGLLDVAALVSGHWSGGERDAVVAAYRAGGAPAGADFDGTLDAARLLVALQWLGWSSTWSPPAEHRHDWQADARLLAERIAG